MPTTIMLRVFIILTALFLNTAICDNGTVCIAAEENSPHCNSNGALYCGNCTCNEGYVGRNCECESTGLSIAQMDMLCRMNNDSSQPLCSGRGYCSCGQCYCQLRPYPDETFFGRYCECDNFNCPRRNRELCSNRGTCNCGRCECIPGYIGAACECPAEDTACRSPNGKVCNDQGVCECGQCRCFKGGQYHGKTCELCATCLNKCDELRPCVMCKGFRTGPLNQTMCNQCPYNYTIVRDHKEHGLNESYQDCQFQNPADDCTVHFRYIFNEFNNDTISIRIRNWTNCPAPIPSIKNF